MARPPMLRMVSWRLICRCRNGKDCRRLITVMAVGFGFVWPRHEISTVSAIPETALFQNGNDLFGRTARKTMNQHAAIVCLGYMQAWVWVVMGNARNHCVLVAPFAAERSHDLLAANHA